MLRIVLLIFYALQLAAGNALPSATYSSACTNDEQLTNPKIVIIGAGVSGIACATKLLEYGFENIEILEAEPRIGGRIHTVPFADNVIELGAQWCEGKKDNVVYELVEGHNVLVPDLGDIKPIRSNREVLTPNVDNALNSIFYNRNMTEIRNYNGSFGSYMENLYFGTLKMPQYAEIDPEVAKEYFETFKKMQLSTDAADSLDVLSVRHISEYWDHDGNHFLWKGKGYHEFLRILLKSHQLGTELGVLEQRVRLSKAATRINWNTGKSNAEITCKDGEVIRADHVIVTVSLGVLKAQHKTLFVPQLPAAKVRAIDGLGFGSVSKIFLEFSEPFWPANWTGSQFLWLKEDLIELRATSRAWLEDVLAFHTISFQPRLLEGWIIGQNARYMETLPKDEVISGCMFLLRKFLTWKIPDPINIKTSAWSSNGNFRGTWSFRSVYTDEVGTSPLELAKPLIAENDRCEKPLVQFAGEATNEHHYGLVNGATETGWREALILAKFYGKDK